MISRAAPTECFVYITLPGQTDAVTAGRFQLAADRSGAPVGRFIYGRSYLDRRGAVELDPVELKLARRYAACGGARHRDQAPSILRPSLRTRRVPPR